ncbi:MAG: hypothetical protein HOP28_06750 [Gemmatimonadales bacterium]|nr:hypothetical protein [Gemmatimonadales bacterium]
MVPSLFGAGSVTTNLRGGLDEASATHRAISTRVAGALQQSTTADFGQELEKAGQGADGELLEQDMAALADTQLRFEATARLLQKAYADLRTAMGGNA